MKSYREIQIEQFEWAKRNFGKQDQRDAALGVVEECGEYEEAMTEKDEEDSVGDAVIYALNLLSLLDVSIDDVVSVPAGAECYTRLGTIGKLAHACLKMHQGIRGTREQHVDEVKTAIGDMIRGFDFPKGHVLRCLNETWERVRLRDWTKNRETGNV